MINIKDLKTRSFLLIKQDIITLLVKACYNFEDRRIYHEINE